MSTLVKKVSFCLCPENMSEAESKVNGLTDLCGTGIFKAEIVRLVVRKQLLNRSLPLKRNLCGTGMRGKTS